MGTLKEKQDALKLVTDAAKIHSQSLETSLVEEFGMQAGFVQARRGYISKLNKALSEVAWLKLDESERISERVSDLNLEDSVDLLHAVEDHIRSLRRTARSNFK